MDGSLNRVTLSELGSSELLLQLCRNLGIPLFGQYALFFRAYSPSRGPQGRLSQLCDLLIRCSFVCLGLGYVVRHVVNGIITD